MYMFTLNIAEFQCSLLLQITIVNVTSITNRVSAKKKLFLRKTSNKLSFYG